MGNKKQIQKTNDTAKKSKPQSRKSRMLSNPDVKRWHDNLARGSPLTAQTSLRRLDRFCQIHSMTPMELADLGLKDLRTLTDVIEDHVTWMEDENYSPGYIGGTIKAIKSWLRHFDVEIRRKIKIRNQDYTPTLQNERVPNEHEISEIFHRAGLRESVMISLMAKSGLRPEVLGNHDGTDGLQMRDLPDIVIHQGVIKCIDSPCRIIVRRELSKARHQYFTFLTASATKTVIAYLNDRLATGEPLHGNSPIVSPDYKYKTHRGANNSKIFLPTSRISKKIRDTFRPRFHWRPYVLRAYFDTQLLIAESKGKIAHDFRTFFMGHKGTIESRYTTNKGILPEILVNEMRESFARSEELLDLERHKEDPTLQQKQQVQGMVQKATPHELGLMLEMIHTMNIGKTAQAR